MKFSPSSVQFLSGGLALLFSFACSSPGNRPDQKVVYMGVPTEPKWDGTPKSENHSMYRPVVGTRGMVVSDDRAASEWGVEILKQGGNAVDAAVATAFALSVSRPQFGSLGGGGFMVFCPKPTPVGPSPCQVIDYRETAPKAATRDMYVRDGKARTDLSQDGALASGVPGVTAGLLMALEKYGLMTRQKILAGPIQMAKNGVVFTGRGEALALERWKEMNAEAKKIFGCGGDGSRPCAPGDLLKQPDLSKVLGEISKSGARGFYSGWVSEKLARGLEAAGGILSTEDLKSYQAKLRAPVHARFKEMEIVSMPPPSAGGTTMLQMFRYADMADQAGAFGQGMGSAETVHALTHAMSLAFADRAQFFGDPDFVKVPTVQLLSEDYLKSRWKTFDPKHAALPSGPGKLGAVTEGTNTTHFSVIDREGNAVAVTTTVNDNFGSGFVPPGTGVVMNNEMDDFSIQPGAPNLFGLVGGDANAIAPGKRPLSSMSPTIVRDAAGNAQIVIGAQGGPRITTSVFLALLSRLRFGMSLPEAVISPRFHHQWKPSDLKYELGGISADTRHLLGQMGYVVKYEESHGRMHALERFTNGRVWGVADPRSEGAAVAEAR